MALCDSSVKRESLDSPLAALVAPTPHWRASGGAIRVVFDSLIRVAKTLIVDHPQ